MLNKKKSLIDLVELPPDMPLVSDNLPRIVNSMKKHHAPKKRKKKAA